MRSGRYSLSGQRSSRDEVAAAAVAGRYRSGSDASDWLALRAVTSPSPSSTRRRRKKRPPDWSLGGCSSSSSSSSSSSGYGSSRSFSGSFSRSSTVVDDLEGKKGGKKGSTEGGGGLRDVTGDVAAASAPRGRDVRALPGPLISVQDPQGPEISVRDRPGPEIPVREDRLDLKCREFLQWRLRSSETLRKRWSLAPYDVTATTADVTATAADVTATTVATTATARKTRIDQKMEFLRKEIAGLMSQDNALFQQLLTLNEAISSLKKEEEEDDRRRLLVRASSLDSFEEEEEEEDCCQQSIPGGGKKAAEKGVRLQEEALFDLVDVDEGLDTDHSTSPTSTLSSGYSTSSKGVRSPEPEAFRRAAAFRRCRKSYAPNARNRRRRSPAGVGVGPQAPIM